MDELIPEEVVMLKCKVSYLHLTNFKIPYVLRKRTKNFWPILKQYIFIVAYLWQEILNPN